MTTIRSRWVVSVLALLALAAPVVAQTGTISGRVTEAGSDRPIGGAEVHIYRQGSTLSAGRTFTAPNGTYRIVGVPAGTYQVRVVNIGHTPSTRDEVTVGDGAMATADFALAAEAVQLPSVEVSGVSGRREKDTFAPASVAVVQSTQMRERPALTMTDHLKTVPGVDISQGGLVQSNVVARGFNNIFSGAMLMLIDNRFASVPSLRVNVPAFWPGTGEDLERMEIVLGPGAALYGPNSSNGVLNVITKSPIDYQGTTLSIEAGLRGKTPYTAFIDGGGNRLYNRYDDAGSLYKLSGRHAGLLGSRMGYKLSGEYLAGDDWQFIDPAEAQYASANGCGATCRDFAIEKYGFEGRVDYRPDIHTSVVVNYGFTNAKNLIELTGIGAGQARGWKYQYGQTRFTHRRFFAQAFANLSNAGDTYLLRSGQAIVDRSRLYAFQVQQGLDMGSRQTFLFGGEYVLTDAVTDGTINGANEDDDTIKELGGYLHSVTRLSSQLELTAALRVDKHSRVDDAQVSPRLALVYAPNDDHAFRATFNRAFSTPSNNSLFLDIPAGQAGPYTVRALGVPKGGFQFRGGTCPEGGVDGLCMRSPFPGADALGLIPANAASLWAVAVGALAQAGAITPQVAQLLAANAPTPAQVGTDLRVLDPTTGRFNSVQGSSVIDVSRILPTTSQVVEIGYKGLIAGAARLSIDLWWENKENFVGPLIVESPNVFLDRAQTIAYLTPIMTAALGNATAGATAAAQIGTGMAGIPGTTGATLGVPLATIVPHNSPLTARPDIFLTYRNFGEVDLLGADFALDVVLARGWSLAGTASFTNKDFYTRADVARTEGELGLSDIALNAPKAKASGTVRYRNERRGLSGEATYRGVKGFPINSGVYVTPLRPDGSRETIPTYSVMDAQVSYRLPVGNQSATLSLIANNLFDQPYQTFIGVPNLGRTLITKLSYTF